MKKQTENTTQNTPPDVGGETVSTIGVKPPATAGGTDTAAHFAQLQTENERLRATIRVSEAHRQITGELAEAGARSPELLFASVRDALQFADDGSLLNAAALVQKLRDAHPEQFGTTAAHFPSIDAGAGVAAVPQLTRDALRAMKPAEIAALDWNDVKRVLAGA